MHNAKPANTLIEVNNTVPIEMIILVNEPIASHPLGPNAFVNKMVAIVEVIVVNIKPMLLFMKGYLS